MRLPLPQYEDVTLLPLLLPLFEVAVRNLQPISVPSFVHMVWLTRVVMDIDFVRSFLCCEPLKCVPFVETSSSLGDTNLYAGWFLFQDSSGSCDSHLSPNGRLLAPDLAAGKLALSTAFLEAAFAGLIALDVLFDSQSLNLPLISKDVVNYLYEIRCLSVEFNCICFTFVSCPAMVMVWFVVNNSSSNGV
ncbi:unnamed protein product [Microthlaspi erraticum]|uniref:Uncharacterized protein n=1 Tax=Microthlaspi erraticum TaxID=1685480 RepID=A0A6D2KHN3_9BRAS|nr:unnamed protein product [Microthlaspi erraticum]